MNLRSLYRRICESQAIIRFLFLITTLEGLVCLFFLLSLPKSASNGWLFGYSLNRITLIVGMLLVNLVLIWFTSNVWRKPALEQKMYALLQKMATRDRLSEQVLTTLSAGFIVAVFLLVLWAFTKDAYYLAYLLRFGPVIIFGTLAIVQILVALLLHVTADIRTEWIWALLFAGILIFLQEWPLIKFNKLGNSFLVLTMLLATFYAQVLFRRGIHIPWTKKLGWVVAIISVGLFLYIELFFIPKKFLMYRQSFFIFSPMILLGLVISTQVIDRSISIMNRNAPMRVLTYIIVLAGLIYAGRLYYFFGTAHSNQVNTTYAPNDDELSFMDFAIQASQTNFHYTGTRNQMPVYPYIQALFYDPDLSLDEFFVRGKQVNIYLSLAGLTVIFLIALKFLPLYQAVNLTLTAAFGLYVYKSGYFLAELLYYTLSASVYLLFCILLVKPSVKLGALTGIILGIGHLTKASVLPALLLFVGLFILKELFAVYDRWKKKKSSLYIESETPSVKVKLACFCALIICYIAVISPYIVESKQKYGSYFYNVNSTFYMWNDSWEEANEQTIAHGDSQGWPDMAPEDIPGPGKYFREHDLSQIWARIQYGLYWQMENIRYQYGFFNYLILFLVFAIICFFLDIKRNLQITKKHIFLAAFITSYFGVYTSLYIWYSPISNLPRFIFALYVPFLISAFLGIKITATEVSMPLIKLTNLTVFLMVLIDIWYSTTFGPFTRLFGG